MKKIIFITILFLAVILRFNKLGMVPYSLDWDEVSLGYNAYSLLLNGTDEYGNTWPLSIRSFNDYKPPAYTYLSIVPIALFGLNEFSTRFISALLGSVTVISVFFLTKEIFTNNKKNHGETLNQEALPFIAMFIFAVSPWHLQFSRAAFEGNIALFFVITGMYLLLKYFNTSIRYYCIAASIFLAGSLYAYHAARLIIPLLLFGIAVRYHKFLLQRKKDVILSVIIGVILVAPLTITLVRGSASSRFTSVTIFRPDSELLRLSEYEKEDRETNDINWLLHNRRLEYLKEFVKGYTDHYSPVGLFMLGDAVERHHAPNMGLFYLIEFPFAVAGLLILIFKKFKYKYLYFFWFAIGPIPAAISTGTPHAIRSILTLPLPQITIAVGIVYLYNSLNKLNSQFMAKTVLTIIALVFTVNFSYYLVQYYVHQDVEYASYWQYGYKEMIQAIQPLENHYQKIIITPAYDQPYIYLLFYKHYDPRIWVNNGSYNQQFDKYEFRKIDWDKDRLLENTLLIGEPLEIPEGEPGTIKVIKFPDGKDVFRIIASQN